MRKTAKQGVPKKPRRDMARPINEIKPKKRAEPKMAGLALTTEPPQVTKPEPKAAPVESVPSMSKVEAAEPELAAVDPGPEPVVIEPEPEPEHVPVESEAEQEAESIVDHAPEPKTSAEAGELGPKAVQNTREMVRRVEESWAAFRAAAGRFPLERMDEHLSEGGWTRKQMLAHIAAWHDLAADRLWKFVLGGQPVYLDREADAINASVARQAIGKTSGEVLKDMEMTYNRLHRQMSRLTDAQLGANDEWAAAIIAGNTFEHYDEHAVDLYLPEPEPTGGRR